jgi:potassium-transporting ATPase potassium-binding subunit
MTLNDILQIAVFLIILIILTPLLGNYMSRVFSSERHFLIPLFGWLERFIFRMTDVTPDTETDWKKYTTDLLIFNVIGFFFVFSIQVFQSHLPLNPNHLPGVKWDSAFNTGVSFMTNTNWQGYAGETTMSYLVQMLGLTVQNFVSAGTGIAVLLALIRGLARKTSETLGCFWVDLTRSVLYILLPLSIVISVFLISQGVIQNFRSDVHATTLESKEQMIPMGPVASQISVKQLGTNGGGYFNTNSAHPFENPTPLSNFIEMLAILLIPAALTYSYGKMIGSVRHGWTIFTAMFLMLVTGLIISLVAEHSGNPVFGKLPLMEGKELRFGITNSVMWSTSTTAASNGSVNAMHSSLTPLAGMIAIINIMLGEVVFGGVGAGLYGMVVFIILTVFIAGLMVGRTPEYLGKKIESYEVRMAILAMLIPNFVILIFTAIATVSGAGLSTRLNAGPHGFSEILYAFSSAAGNNGSAFAGLNANTLFYNLSLGLGMILGRFGVIIPVMAIAGSLVRKKITPLSSGTFRTDNGLFIMLLIGVIIIICGLTFFPSLALGPIVEHFLLKAGVLF